VVAVTATIVVGARRWHQQRPTTSSLLSTLCTGGVHDVRSHLRVLRSDVRELSDPELLARLRTDDDCLREFVGRHHSSVHRLAVATLRSTADAEEAVQDTFIAAHRSAERFRGESSARTWLHTICYRRCLVVLRKRHLQVVAVDDVSLFAGTDTDHVLRLALDAAVASLNDDPRVAFTLVDVLGFSREDAARLVGVPGNTMRARVARARMLLADAMTDREDES
jgi:RNA polymerase sigma-70 factor, ECF subfamily